MKRFMLVLAVPALVAFGCSSEHPQQAVHVSGSASMTGPTAEPKVVGSETKAGARTAAEADYDAARDRARSETRTETRTDGTRTTETDVTRTTPPRDAGTVDVKPVKPADTGTTGQPGVKGVDANLNPGGSVNVDSSKGYFEVTKNGKTYCFSSLAAMQKFNNGDTSASFTEKTGPNGEHYWVESSHADSLSAEYVKAHPAK